MRLTCVQELLYASRQAARRQALGVLDTDATSPPDGLQGDKSNAAAAESKAQRAKEAERALLRGKLAQLVHDNAIQELPRDFALRRGMLRIVAQVPCLGQTALAEAIAQRALADFGEVCYNIYCVHQSSGGIAELHGGD